MVFNEAMDEVKKCLADLQPGQKVLPITVDALSLLLEAYEEAKDEVEDQRVTLLIYRNLREHFTRLTRMVLGKNYYNESMDTYKADEYTCRDIWNKKRPLFARVEWPTRKGVR